MSSYVAVQGTPRKDNCFVFGLTPKEVRYLRVSFNTSQIWERLAWKFYLYGLHIIKRSKSGSDNIEKVFLFLQH